MSLVSDVVKKVVAAETAPPPLVPVAPQKWWVVYAKDAYTTALWMELALRRVPGVQVLTVGINQEIPTGDTVTIPELLTRAEVPDVILVMDGFRPLTLHGLERFKGPKLYYALDTHLNPHRPVQEWAAYDAVFTPHQEAIARWGGKGLWLPHAAEPLVHYPLPRQPLVYDVAFVGGTDLAEPHRRRRELLKALSAKYKIFVGRAYGVFMSMIYAKSKLVFNCSVGGEINMRVFEGAACRRPVVTDALAEDRGLGTLFPPEALATYTDDASCLAQVDRLLKDEPARVAMAEQAFQQVGKAHTYTHRIQVLRTWLSQHPKT